MLGDLAERKTPTSTSSPRVIHRRRQKNQNSCLLNLFRQFDDSRSSSIYHLITPLFTPRGQAQRSVHEGQWGENDRWGPGGPHRTGSPYGIRTRAATLRGWCPRPLDERAVLRAEGYRDPPPNSHASAAAQCAGPRAGTSSMVGVRGLEPRITEPESAVLPITPHPIGRTDCTGEPSGATRLSRDRSTARNRRRDRGPHHRPPPGVVALTSTRPPPTSAWSTPPHR